MLNPAKSSAHHGTAILRRHRPREKIQMVRRGWQIVAVTVGSRNTRYRAARHGLTRTGLSPVGPHQLWLALSEIQASRWRVAGGRGTNPLHATSMFYPSDEDRDAVTAPPVPGLG